MNITPICITSKSVYLFRLNPTDFDDQLDGMDGMDCREIATDIHGPQRMNTIDFGDQLTCDL